MKKRVVIIFIVLIVSFLIYFIFCNKEVSVEDMTLREKIGQMLMVYYNGDDVSENLISSLKTNKPGAFIVTGANLNDYDKARKLLTTIRKIDKNIIVAVDQEGGTVQRLYDIKDIKSTFIPNMHDVGLKNDTNISYRIGSIIGSEVSSIGCNAVFSPSLDIGDYNTSAMGTRLFSDDKDIVIENAMAMYSGIKDSGVLPIVKHFPGIGNTSYDTHDKEVAIVLKDYDELYNEDLQPFIKAIDEGVNIIMVGHTSYPKITNDNLPASLSKTIVNDILRDKLNYDGVVISDAVNMSTIAYNYSEKYIYTTAINAGVDMFIMPNGSKRVIDMIEEAVNNGEIDEELINKSVTRILKLKKTISKKDMSKSSFNNSSSKKFICDNFSDYCIYNK